MLVLIGEAAPTDDLASALLDVNSDLVEERRRLDLVDVQRELQRRATDLERALAVSEAARRRIASLERRLADVAHEAKPSLGARRELSPR